mmetsp:Transcript_25746/g.47994  ORF Transcript_25746/g.47994 Transcript_25746/m.47994 type:complete len:86 (+) Transcript_25746:579-836(+)
MLVVEWQGTISRVRNESFAVRQAIACGRSRGPKENMRHANEPTASMDEIPALLAVAIGFAGERMSSSGSGSCGFDRLFYCCHVDG